MLKTSDPKFARDERDCRLAIAGENFDFVLARDPGHNGSRVGAQLLPDREHDGALRGPECDQEASGHAAATRAASASALQKATEPSLRRLPR